MDIASLSMVMGQANLMTQVSTAVLSMGLDSVELAGENLVKLMEQSVTPNLGQTLDLKV